MTRFDLVTMVAVAAAVVLSGAASFALLARAMPAAAPATHVVDPFASPIGSVEGGGELVIDVEGGVQSPGIHRLPAGSRVADALAAAGGYADSADLAAAAAQLNLAAVLVDGQQVVVPVLGAEPASGGDPGLVNLNAATQAELEELPGIGPVTAGKIIAARDEQPFATLEELVSRDVLTSRQLGDIAGLVTVP
jgi:competence protein ComEA